MPNKAQPVHFRVVKHGHDTGKVFAVVLTGTPRRTDCGQILLPSFDERTGKCEMLQTWVRHHTRRAKPDEYARLASIMKSFFGPLDAMPSLTTRLYKM